CRRARTWPRNRPKPCRECSTAKHKCSLQARCTRCTKKGLDCVYPGNKSHGSEDSTEIVEQHGLVPTLSTFDLTNPNPPFTSEASMFDEQLQWDSLSLSQTFELTNELTLGDFPLIGQGSAHRPEQRINGVTGLTTTPETCRQIMSHCINHEEMVIPDASWIIFPLQFIGCVNQVAQSSPDMIK
ncbi:hypothetical protein CORC01_12459, partial [Colletotrichum orchidophilum]